ncbi:KamA family radical SAM protein [Desulfonatronovibrio hydrogenovorans]|uniref:KamA family radical SAM protein n=1 Tax=Desulfonatronovibrio hydrogenovorans TaxID=53245 RepID=UPI00048E2123|nr:KamA family radical SAM protein [Desulfonatronovibrio hydrogenovorans]
MNRPKYINEISKVGQIPEKELEDLAPVMQKFEFRSNDYYLSLINWDDPNDPIKRIIIPCQEELDQWGKLDPSNEKKYSKMPGLQHKYLSTAVFLASDTCGGYCRYCFRKRLFIYPEQREVLTDYQAALDYVRSHPEINNVLITGGDGLMLSTARLEELISSLRTIKHVKIIRIGTKLLSYDPYRVINDPGLIKLVEEYSLPHKRIYFMLHFSHPREITQVSLEACNRLIKAGGILCNQTPMLRGVNDDPQVMGELFNQLSYMGIAPYYIFLCRPTVGNLTYAVPVEEAFHVFQTARGMCSGLGKRAKLAMSHAEGKIEVVAMTDENIIFRIHRAADPDDSGKVFICRRNPSAYWFDDYREILETIHHQDLGY